MKKFPFRHIFVPILPLCLVLCLTVCLASCTDQEKRGGQRVREVAVFKLVPQQVSLTAELSGRVSAFRKAEVRPQVSGILQKQLFTEGTIVQQGQSLYKIDPDTYIAAVESARAARASAEAQLHAAKLRFDRRRALLRSQAVSRQSYEDSLAAQQYQDALSQQQFDNDVASQKLAIAQGEWALKRSQAEQEAAAASLRAAGRTAGGSTGAGSSPSGGSTGSTGSTGATAGSAAPAASSGGIDYQTFANQMRSRGYTIAEIKEMFDLLRANR